MLLLFDATLARFRRVCPDSFRSLLFDQIFDPGLDKLLEQPGKPDPRWPRPVEDPASTLRMGQAEVNKVQEPGQPEDDQKGPN